LRGKNKKNKKRKRRIGALEIEMKGEQKIAINKKI